MTTGDSKPRTYTRPRTAGEMIRDGFKNVTDAQIASALDRLAAQRRDLVAELERRADSARKILADLDQKLAKAKSTLGDGGELEAERS